MHLVRLARGCVALALVPITLIILIILIILIMGSSAVGCVIDAEPEPLGLDSCSPVACSHYGYCDAGHCYCDPGFVGDPYALHGCQPTAPNSPCDTTCGLNAYCDAGACVCADGFVAVCGTGDCIEQDRLCDGTSDCTNEADEDDAVCFPAAVQDWLITDACDDGIDIVWRLFSLDRGWAWPNADSTFVTRGLFVETGEAIECVEGETVCFGASAGERSWGVGLDGAESCEDCCWQCAADTVDVGELACG